MTPDRYGTEDVVWLLTPSEDAHARYLHALEQLAASAPRRLRVLSAIVATETPLEAPPQFAPHQRLAAAIVVLGAHSLEHEDFAAWARTCVDLLATDPGFRLFLDVREVPAEELRDSDVARTLIDIAQTSARDEVEICAALRVHLQQLDRVLAGAQWQEAQTFVARYAGIMARILRRLVALPALMLVLWLTRWSEAAAVLIGVVLYSCAVPLIFAATARMRGDWRPVRRLGMAAIVLLAIVMLIARRHPPPSWIALGIVFGLLLDLVHRGGLDAQRRRSSLSKAFQSTENLQLAFHLAEAAWPPQADPFVCTLLPPAAPRVFISYARASAWSERTAQALHARVSESGGIPFLDAASIAAGSSWPAALGTALADADIFIALVDEETVHHRWVAAEWLAALDGRVLTGRPELVVIRNGSPGGGLPVFRTVLEHVDPDDALSLPTLPGVLPSWLRTILDFFSLPLMAVGTQCALLGIAASIMVILELQKHYSVGDRLAARGLLEIGCLLAAFYAGYAARQALIARLQGTIDNPVFQSRLQLFAAGALASLAAVWAPRLPPLLLAWAIACVPLGWLTCSAQRRFAT